MSGEANPNIEAQCETLREGVGFARLETATQIELSGSDRAKFLQNFCTNDVHRLEEGSGCEAFITNVQGKILGHVHIFRYPESLIIETVAGQAESLISHLDRYLIMEDVQMRDISSDRGEVMVCGKQAPALLANLLSTGEIREILGHVTGRMGEVEINLRRFDTCGPMTFLIDCQREILDAVVDRLTAEGAMPCDHSALEICRIEQGTPLYGRDISSDNLPQEIGRDQRTISFTKGCYLGQETVARIDALGHVNKILVGLRFDGNEPPAPGTQFEIDGKQVGRLTSSAFSPRLATAIGLGFVRREYSAAGTAVHCETGQAEVVQLPL